MNPSLFDDLTDPLVRPSDPATSHAAAASVDPGPREQKCVDALRFLAVASSTWDIQQVLATYGLNRDRNCLSRRLLSLVRKGLSRRLLSLVRKGLVDDRGLKPGPYGRQVTAYRLAS